MANARTAVVVKKSPIAAVAVNKDRSILSTILEIIIIFLIKKFETTIELLSVSILFFFNCSISN